MYIKTGYQPGIQVCRSGRDDVRKSFLITCLSSKCLDTHKPDVRNGIINSISLIWIFFIVEQNLSQVNQYLSIFDIYMKISIRIIRLFYLLQSVVK
jgi:hypothetical protein